MADIIVIADEDDVGIRQVVEAVSRMGLDPVWLRLGATDAACGVQLTPDESPALEIADTRLNDEVFASAQLVFYHRWHQGPIPVVKSSLADATQRAFAEREWEAAVHTALLAFERRHSNVVWSLPSSSRSTVTSRYELLSIAVDCGLNAPTWIVSTEPSAPASLGDPLVAKPVNLWERVSEGSFFGTSRILASVAETAISEASSNPPTCFQRLIPRRTELRVYFVFGSAVCVEMRGNNIPVDIRNARPEDLSVRLIECPKPLLTAISQCCAALDLGFCVFDFVIAEDGSPWLVDVTHNGSWDHFETDRAPWLSEAIAEAIVRTVEKEAEV
jgi:hypothetical protein